MLCRERRSLLGSALSMDRKGWNQDLADFREKRISLVFLDSKEMSPAALPQWALLCLFLTLL